MRVLVCGGRDFDDWEFFCRNMDWLDAPFHFSIIIHGGASGADNLASLWAQRSAVNHIEFKADWARHGKAAGPIRNQEMIDKGLPQLVIAFPGGRGTADMVKRAKKHNIRVVQFP